MTYDIVGKSGESFLKVRIDPDIIKDIFKEDSTVSLALLLPPREELVKVKWR